LKEAASPVGPAPASPSRSPVRRRLAVLFGLILLGGGIWGGLLLSQNAAFPGKPPPALPRRIVSLSPGVTETVEALGADARLVGVSDYCEPKNNQGLRRAGTALTPNYEIIAELAPDVILTSEVKGAQLGPLQKLAKTEQLPWLSLHEWMDSILRLGRILGQEGAAEELRQKISATLEVSPPPDAPRVLLALDYGDTGSDETWFIRENSIHGAVLRAAGAKNAVTGEVLGHPQLSPERLLEIDPDAIVVLTSRPSRTSAQVRAYFSKWTPLRAVKNGRISAISVPGALTVGPSVLGLVPLIRKEIASLPRAQR
jgi:iron complex transport system substrate-binding protein